MTYAMKMMLLGTTRLMAPDAPPGAEPLPPVEAEDPPPPGYTDPPPVKPAAEPGAAPPVVNNDGNESRRPADLPDQFWDPKKNSLRLDALIKSHNDTKKMVGEKEDATRARLRDELMAELAPTDLPEKPEGYVLAKEIEGLVSSDDPLLAAFRAAAHEAKLAPAAFNAIVAGVLKANPPPDAAAETAKLGANASLRIDRVSKLVARHVTDPALGKLAASLATTADGVRLIESLTGVKVAEDRVGNGGEAGTAAPSMAQIKVAMADDRYQPGPMQDPAYVAQVDTMKDQYFKAKGQTRTAQSRL